MSTDDPRPLEEPPYTPPHRGDCRIWYSSEQSYSVGLDVEDGKVVEASEMEPIFTQEQLDALPWRWELATSEPDLNGMNWLQGGRCATWDEAMNELRTAALVELAVPDEIALLPWPDEWDQEGK